jgi:hypothetical protein
LHEEARAAALGDVVALMDRGNTINYLLVLPLTTTIYMLLKIGKHEIKTRHHILSISIK